MQELRILTAIIDTGSFQNAAKAMYISQPAVSQSIANLEKRLGEKVLIRHSPIRPTPIGKELLKTARQILDKEQSFSKNLHKMKDGYLQKISVAVDYLVSSEVIHSVMVSTIKKFPKVTFVITKLPGREVIEAVRGDEKEMGFGSFQRNMNELKKIQIFREKILLVTGKRNPHLKHLVNDYQEFLSKTVLLTSYLDPPELRPSKVKIRDYFEDIWQINDIGLQIKLLSLGQGVTYVPERILRNHPTAKNFKVLNSVPFYAIEKPYGIFYKESSTLSETTKTFIQEAKRHAS